MLSKPILLNNFKRSFQMNEDYLLNESVKNGEFGDKNQFTWIYDKPFKILTIQEQGHKTGSDFKELEVKGILEGEAKKLMDKIQSVDYLSWNIIKSIVKKEHPLFRVLSEGLNEEESGVDKRIDDLANDPKVQKKMDGASAAKLKEAFLMLFKRGYGAAQTNWGAVNPNIKKLGKPAAYNAWGYARLNAFIEKSKGYQTTDSDIADWLKGKGEKPKSSN
jgi:hypothetical protein